MAAPQQSNSSDNSAGMIWGIAAAFALIGGIWYAFKTTIVKIYLTAKLYEIDLISIFNEGHFNDLKSSIKSVIANPSTVKFEDVVALGASVGDWLRYPIVLLLIALAVVVYLGNTTRVFRHVYSMLDLAKLEKTNWPQIAPIVDLDLLKIDIDKGPWAMAMLPMQFCKSFHLIDEVRPERREGMSRKDWDKVEVVLRRGAANKVFALQLGALWRGADKLPPHVRALFAVFAARINADSKPAAEILAQLSASSTSKLNMTGVTELLKKHENTKLVKQITESHAYVLTVMASMLQGAREDGVQASADFLWLKPLDRRLWYVLNTVGRQTPFVEIAGVFAHWVAEKEAGRKLLVPTVEEATNALDLALKEIVYRPDETETMS